jgi:hypothetical protein
MKRSRPPREVKLGYNSDIRSLNYRFVNARNGEFNLNDSKGLLDACAKGFSEHPQLPKAVPASAFADLYLQCRNRCHGPESAEFPGTGARAGAVCPTSALSGHCTRVKLKVQLP